MKKVFLTLLTILLSITVVFAIGPSNKSATSTKVVASNAKVDDYATISQSDKDAMICFLTFVMTADDAEDWDDDGPFGMMSGRIKDRSMNGIDVYDISRNATFVSISDRSEVFAEDVSGTFTFEDDYGLYAANMSGKFPTLDSKVHSFNWQTNAPMQKNKYSMPFSSGAKVTVDGKVYNLDEKGVIALYQDVYALIAEYMRYAFM